MIGEGEWEQTTVKEARLLQEEGFVQDKSAGDYLIWWRPNYTTASRENPDEDIAYILEVK